MKSKSLMHKRRMWAILGFILLLVIYLVPVFWVALTSLKPDSIVSTIPPRIFFVPTLKNFVGLQVTWDFFSKMYHSLVIASGTTIVCILVGIIAAYALSRFKIKRKQFILVWILSNRFLPVVAILLPLFIFFRKLGLVDTYASVIMATTIPNLAFSIWLLHSFFADIPLEIEESGKIDGCSDWGILWRIVFPITRPSIAVTALFVFLFSWNEFFIPLVLTRTKVPPVTVAFASFRQYMQMDWGGMSAAALVCLAPLLLIVALLHRHVVRGLTLGAVKG